jgi:hypothetical protein
MALYTHYYIKNYESPFGYRWTIENLPSWLSIEINTEGDTKYIYIHSTIHVDKCKRWNSYSLNFTDTDILKDCDLYKSLSGYL